MKIVLLSGGSGKRLWPLSNEANSKQFLRLLSDERGRAESMVQRVVRQIKSALPEAEIFVSSNAAQKDMLSRQLSGAELILEPEHRDTFAALVLTAAYLKYEKGAADSDCFIALPIDVFAGEAFFYLLSDVSNLVEAGAYKIGLLGAIPTYPSEKYGYILSENGQVTGFREKPDANTAAKLMENGALWNCGVFALCIGYILGLSEKYLAYDSYVSLFERYSRLPKISFDYEVAEKEPSIGVVKYSGVWKDLGTWNTLTDEMKTRTLGRDIFISEDGGTTHVLNMLDIPIVSLGIKDAVIVASHDGILVSGKEQSARLKPFAEQIERRPMYEQQGWGNYRVLSYKENAGGASVVKSFHVEAGRILTCGAGARGKKIWTVTQGTGTLFLDGTDSAVSPGFTAQIPANTAHKMFAATDIDFIEVQII